MAAEESTPAIVLRARDYSESDRIVSLLTRDFGRLSGIAKGAKASRRRFERKLEPFSHVILYFRRRPHGELVFITRAERSETAPPILEDDLGKIALGSYMLELAEALTREEAEAEDAYSVLVEALAAVGDAGASRSIRNAYELKILAATGFALEFGRCRVCASAIGPEDAAAYFVVSRGGVVCARCRSSAPEGAVRISAANALAMARLARARFSEVGAMEHGGIDGTLAISRFLTSILDRKLRSSTFLDTIL